MNEAVALQQVTQKSILSFREICHRVYTINFGDHWLNDGLAVYLEEQFGAKKLEGDLDDPYFLYYFITYKNEKVGFVKVHLNAHMGNSRASHCAELEKIYVLPEFKGKGIGTTTMNLIFDKLKDCSRNELILYVIDTNKSAISFYQKMDFVIHGRTRLEAPQFKEELRGMYLMGRKIN